MSHYNHANTLICHTTMCRNPINFLYNLGQVTLSCVEVGLVANARKGSIPEHDGARVLKSNISKIYMHNIFLCIHLLCSKSTVYLHTSGGQATLTIEMKHLCDVIWHHISK